MAVDLARSRGWVGRAGRWLSHARAWVAASCNRFWTRLSLVAIGQREQRAEVSGQRGCAASGTEALNFWHRRRREQQDREAVQVLLQNGLVRADLKPDGRTVLVLTPAGRELISERRARP